MTPQQHDDAPAWERLWLDSVISLIAGLAFALLCIAAFVWLYPAAIGFAGGVR